MRMKTLTLAALLAACTATQKTPDEPKKSPEPEPIVKVDVPVVVKPEPIVKVDVPVGAVIDAFGAT